MEEGLQPQDSEQCRDSEGEVEICEAEMDILFQAEGLVMEQDKEPEDQSEDSGDDSDIDTDKGNDDGNESDYVPNSIRGSCGRAGVSCKRAGASNLSATFTCKQGTKDSCEGGKQEKRYLAYEFCPLPHRPSILHLLTKHFCQHPLLPERHGQPWTAEHIHHDSVYEMYLHCSNNHLREVWAYLWTNWGTCRLVASFTFQQSLTTFACRLAPIIIATLHRSYNP